jgi:hypothetical protein
MLGLPAAYLYSGAVTATFMTCSFAAMSVVACVLIANTVRVYKEERMKDKISPGAAADSLDHAPHLEMGAPQRARQPLPWAL